MNDYVGKQTFKLFSKVDHKFVEKNNLFLVEKSILCTASFFKSFVLILPMACIAMDAVFGKH